MFITRWRRKNVASNKNSKWKKENGIRKMEGGKRCKETRGVVTCYIVIIYGTQLQVQNK